MIDSYKKRIAAMGGYEGESKRRNSQKIMDASWMRDTATKPVYVKWVDSGLPEVHKDDIPVYAKFNVKSYHNITGDEIAYLLQFRAEDMINNPDIKVGSYVQITNELGDDEWWLIWHLDDRTQFRQFSILKCTWVYKWVSVDNGIRTVHQCLGVTRNQNNYNSGVWLDYTFQVVEQQHVMMMPSNKDTNTILYDTKFLVSNEGRYPPIAWKISKIQPSVVNDTVRFTMTQEQFNSSTDDEIEMIANYKTPLEETDVPDVQVPPVNNNLEIVCSGQPAVRAGGGYKKFTLKQNLDGQLVDAEEVDYWIAKFPDGDDTELKFDLEYKVDRNISCKVKCGPAYDRIGHQFILYAYSNTGLLASIAVEVTSI